MRLSWDIETEYKAWPRRLDWPSRILHFIVGFLVGLILVAPTAFYAAQQSDLLPSGFVDRLGLSPLLLSASIIAILTALVWLRIMLAFRRGQWWKRGDKTLASVDDRNHFAAGFLTQGWGMIVGGAALLGLSLSAALSATSSLLPIYVVFLIGGLTVGVGLLLRKMGSMLQAQENITSFTKVLRVEKLILSAIACTIVAAILYRPGSNIGYSMVFLAYLYNIYANSALAVKWASLGKASGQK